MKRRVAWAGGAAAGLLALSLGAAYVATSARGLPRDLRGEWVPVVERDGARRAVVAAPGCPGPNRYRLGAQVEYFTPSREAPDAARRLDVTRAVAAGERLTVETSSLEAKGGLIALGRERRIGQSLTLTRDPRDAHLLTISVSPAPGELAGAAVAHVATFTDAPETLERLVVPCAPDQPEFAEPLPEALQGTWKLVAPAGDTFAVLVAEEGCRTSWGAPKLPRAFRVAGGAVRFFVSGGEDRAPADPENPSEVLLAAEVRPGPPTVVVTQYPSAPYARPGVSAAALASGVILTFAPDPKEPRVTRISATLGGAPAPRMGGLYTRAPKAFKSVIRPCKAGEEFFEPGR